ncbi:hypothetical protein GN956_G21646 [Arapaima gigas]
MEMQKIVELKECVADPKEKEGKSEVENEGKPQAETGGKEESDYRSLLSAPENIYDTPVSFTERKVGGSHRCFFCDRREQGMTD